MLKPSGVVFLFNKEVQEIFDNFTSCFGIRINYFSPDGKELKVGLHKGVCPFCELIQKKLGIRELCVKSDEHWCREAANKKQVVYYTCHAGLQEAIYPVFFENTLLGFIVIGQFRNKDIPFPHILQLADKKDIPQKEVTDSFKNVPQYSSKKISTILNLFTVLAKYIVSQHLIGRKGDLSIDTITSYLKEKITEHVSLSEVARLVGKSNSYVSHLFTNKFNKSFSRFFTEMKIDKANDFFRIMPQLSVSEVAYKLGYDDPLYFSRAYKKLKNIAPREYKKRYATARAAAVNARSRAG